MAKTLWRLGRRSMSVSRDDDVRHRAEIDSVELDARGKPVAYGSIMGEGRICIYDDDGTLARKIIDFLNSLETP
jgi:hypothetical protein